MKLHKPAIFIALTITSFSCTKDFEGEYADPSAIEIVDTAWNETDARKTSEVLIHSMISKPWLKNFKSDSKKDPFVIVMGVENRTDEHIDTKAMSESVRYEVINSGTVRFVDGAGRENIVKELQYQNDSGMVNKNSAKTKGNQIGADFMLTGSISSQVHTNQGLKTVTYQTMMQLTDLSTGEIVWNEKYDIKKRFKRSGSGW